ncbi:unnamed protein product [Boreogadus saida]
MFLNQSQMEGAGPHGKTGGADTSTLPALPGGEGGGRCLMVGDWSGVQLLQLRGINTIITNVIFRTTQATADSPGPCKPCDGVCTRVTSTRSRPGEPVGEYLPHKTFILA